MSGPNNTTSSLLSSTSQLLQMLNITSTTPSTTAPPTTVTVPVATPKVLPGTEARFPDSAKVIFLSLLGATVVMVFVIDRYFKYDIEQRRENRRVIERRARRDQEFRARYELGPGPEPVVHLEVGQQPAEVQPAPVDAGQNEQPAAVLPVPVGAGQDEQPEEAQPAPAGYVLRVQEL